MNTIEMETDVLVVGGGTAGPMAAVKAKEANPKLRVMLLEKANVKRSGAISMGMDGLNNAVIPGHATPEQYTKEITIANDGIVNQKTVYAYANHSYRTIEQLDRWGVKFEKDETGDYAMRKVHHLGTYVLPMPEGHHMKKILYRQLKKARVDVVNRVVGTRILKDSQGKAAGLIGFDCRTGDFACLANPAQRIGLLGTVAHEFFHAWNMERLRARDLEPFDFERANMSDALWFAEGFTSYYDDLFIRRAGSLPAPV